MCTWPGSTSVSDAPKVAFNPCLAKLSWISRTKLGFDDSIVIPRFHGASIIKILRVVGGLHQLPGYRTPSARARIDPENHKQSSAEPLYRARRPCRSTMQ